jgi:hypothetical protein
MFIPDLNFSIPDPGSASKKLSILTKKIVSKHPGSRVQKGTGSRIRIRNIGMENVLKPKPRLLDVIYW